MLLWREHMCVLYISIFTDVFHACHTKCLEHTAIMLVLGGDCTSRRQSFFCSCLSSIVYFSYFKLSFILPLMHVQHCRLTADLKCMLTLAVSLHFLIMWSIELCFFKYEHTCQYNTLHQLFQTRRFRHFKFDGLMINKLCRMYV